MHLTCHIMLQRPPANLVYALQRGSGSQYQTVQVQFSVGNDLYFDAEVEVKDRKPGSELPDFKGPFVQGPLNGRFIYLDIGSYAGDQDSWSGRLKIPLTGITWNMITTVSANPEPTLQTIVPGTGKNGKPNCATVKPFEGWEIKL